MKLIKIAILGVMLGLGFFNASFAAEKTIGVFVALADNEHQGLVPVPKKLGNGLDPDNNLYWGSADGLKTIFDKSKYWTLLEKSENDSSHAVLRTRVYQSKQYPAKLIAKAYNGAYMQQAISDFEQALAHDEYDLVVFIGHNGLMDFNLNLPDQTTTSETNKNPAAMVLACQSKQYFKSRIESLGGKPTLLTTQFMYPGAFILRDAVNDWLKGKDSNTIRASAGRAYAHNQNISVRAATGIFANLAEVK
ncbi:hypothetical protein [Thiofilum flexile]|uniref:hypothetical protein n=1 Tax=Thiofilum flexile TaxID=125627 RepID=UPI0003617B11|nr:hypothetical protein [Thiofilum flexile]